MKYPVLFLDDDNQWLTIYCNRLPQKHYTIEATTSLPHALKRLQVLPFPVIISDLRLIGFGNTGGFTLLDEARKNNRYTRVIIITAYGGAATAIANQAIEKGAFNYLTKPVDFNELDKCIITAITSWEQEINESISLGFITTNYVSQIFTGPTHNETSCIEQETSTASAKVFISYSSCDHVKVKNIVKILRENSISLWYDKEQVKLGDSPFSKINKALQHTRIMLTILSKKAINSGWVNEETEAMFNQRIKNKNLKIIPVLLDDVEIPLLLRNRRALDLQKDFDSGITELIQLIKSEIKTDI